jgi:hypothetical protein
MFKCLIYKNILLIYIDLMENESKVVYLWFQKRKSDEIHKQMHTQGHAHEHTDEANITIMTCM